MSAHSRASPQTTMSRMVRPLRIEYEGAPYHVTARGTARQAVYLDVEDRLRFLGVLATTVERFGLVLHAYVLVGNHYHGFVETPRANLARAMQYLNGVYAL